MIRTARSLSRPASTQAARFLLVGACSYLFNLALYTVGLAAGLNYLVAATASYACGYSLNFAVNRHWTFGAGDGAARSQFLRFSVIAAAALVLDLAILRTLVEVVGVARLPAQAVAVAFAAPVSFLGNRLWSFRPVPAAAQGEPHA